jgi:PAS domain S-box-containing protein
MDRRISCETLHERIKELEREVETTSRLRSALSEAEEKYRLIVEHANDAIFILQDGMVKYANPKATEIASSLLEEIQRSHSSKFLHPDDREMVMERHDKRVRGEKILNMYPLRILNSRGETIWTEVNAVAIQWENRPATLNIIRDISAQKLAEKHHMQAESLSTLKTLAGGLAHSFNNLLMGIQGRVSLLQKRKQHESEYYHLLDGIEHCVTEAADLTRQMLGFAQTGKYNIKPIDLNSALERATGLLDRKGKEITVNREYAKDLWPVSADETQIQHAVTQVLLNAWQAIAERGIITIATENIHWQEGCGRHQQLPAGRYVQLAITDTGRGMDETVRKRVFEPFFTTKGLGEHRGLGLSRVYGIIANHGGWIDIESTPSAGTCVKIFLPPTEES